MLPSVFLESLGGFLEMRYGLCSFCFRYLLKSVSPTGASVPLLVTLVVFERPNLFLAEFCSGPSMGSKRDD